MMAKDLKLPKWSIEKMIKLENSHMMDYYTVIKHILKQHLMTRKNAHDMLHGKKQYVSCIHISHMILNIYIFMYVYIYIHNTHTDLP